MQTLFNLDTDYAIESCDYHTYPTPILHPDRILPFHDLVFVLDGSWEIYQDGEPFLCEAGDAILLAAGHHHYGKVGCAPGTRTIFVHFYEIGAKEPGANSLAIETIVRHGNGYMLKRLLDELVFQNNIPATPENPGIVSSLLKTILCQIYTLQTVTGTANRSIYSVAKRILEDPSRFIPTKELADLAGMSERQFRTRFIQVFKQTPHNYQMSEKLRGAREMLLNYPEAGLKEIASCFGFYDAFHLSRSFKKAYGVSPTTYRKDNSSPGRI